MGITIETRPDYCLKKHLRYVVHSTYIACIHCMHTYVHACMRVHTHAHTHARTHAMGQYILPNTGPEVIYYRDGFHLHIRCAVRFQYPTLVTAKLYFLNNPFTFPFKGQSSLLFQDKKQLCSRRCRGGGEKVHDNICVHQNMHRHYVCVCVYQSSSCLLSIIYFLHVGTVCACMY